LRCSVIRVLLPALLPAILVLSANGCSGKGSRDATGTAGETISEWKYQGYDKNGSHIFPAKWNKNWEPVQVGRTPLPRSFSSGSASYYADVLGALEPEIVLFSKNRLLVFSVEGKLFTNRAFTGYPRKPGFLYDFDRDGKKDLFTGSHHASRPTLSVINGMGNEIFRHRLEETGRDYRYFFPALAENGIVYILAREKWPSPPRGIVACTLNEFKECWEFYIPSDPLGIAVQYDEQGEEVLTISHMSRHTGEFPYLGREMREVQGMDNSLALFITKNGGNILSAESLNDEKGEPLIGNGRFFPMGSKAEDPLLLKQDFKDFPSIFMWWIRLQGRFALQLHLPPELSGISAFSPARLLPGYSFLLNRAISGSSVSTIRSLSFFAKGRFPAKRLRRGQCYYRRKKRCPQKNRHRGSRLPSAFSSSPITELS